MSRRNLPATFLRLRRTVAGAFLLLAGCGLPAPTERHFDFVRHLPPPPGPYARVTAVADIDGEKLSPTQPYPTKPPVLVSNSITADDAWGFTIFDRNACRKKIEEMRHGGHY